jgi:hypothetical protein
MKDWNSSMNIQLVKKNNVDQDMLSYEKNLRQHKLKTAGMVVAVIAIIGLCLYGIKISLDHRSYTTCEVVRSFDRSDTITTKYTEFLSYVIKYSKDGISCVDSENNLVWSQTYNMQDPVINVCQDSLAIADRNGTDVMIFNQTGMQGQVQTLLPIRQISVSQQGVLAVLLEDGDTSRVNLYAKDGSQIVESKFELSETGYPLRIAISADATKLAVSFLQVQNGSISSCVAFYNFDSVGENYEDHLVSSKILQGTVMPDVQYTDSTHCFFAGAGELLFFEGTQIPEETADVTIEQKILSIFSSSKYIGVVTEGEEKSYALQVYNMQGKQEFRTEFDQDYTTLKFSGNNILIYNDFEYTMMNHAGNIFFEGTFEESISDLYTLSGNNRYMVLHAGRTDQIRLK